MFRAPGVRGRLGRRRYRERLRCRPRWNRRYRHRAWGRQNSSPKGHRHPKSWGCPHCRCHRRHCFHLERRFRFPSQKHCPPPNRKRSPRPRRRSPRQTHRWSLRLPEPRAQQGKHSMPHQRRKTPPDLSEGRRGDKARDERRRGEDRQRLASAVIYKSTSHDSPYSAFGYAHQKTGYPEALRRWDGTTLAGRQSAE